MIQPIVHTATGMTLFGGGKIRKQQIRRAVKLAPFVLAADKGALAALAHGIMPDAVVGDMDGKAGGMRGQIPAGRIHRIEEQDSTDFEKCLYSLSAPFVLALGVTGSRLDHSLAAMNALGRHPDLPVVILSGKDLCFLSPAELALDLPVGTRLSLFPLATVRGRSSGLRWPIDGLEFSPLHRIGTSNRTSHETVRLAFDARSMLVIVPVRHLETVIARLVR